MSDIRAGLEASELVALCGRLPRNRSASRWPYPIGRTGRSTNDDVSQHQHQQLEIVCNIRSIMYCASKSKVHLCLLVGIDREQHRSEHSAVRRTTATNRNKASAAAHHDLGTSFEGQSSKKLVGFNMTVIFSLGITGKSSGLVTCVTPNVCHSTTSSSTVASSLFAQIASPVSSRLWFVNSPAAQSSSSRYFVTQMGFEVKIPRRRLKVCGPIIIICEGTGWSL